jgi:hypothetical protein
MLKDSLRGMLVAGTATTGGGDSVTGSAFGPSHE